MEKVSAHLWISGRVQGVCYRAWAETVANELLLSGWVRNSPDGRVEAFIEGEKGFVDRMIEKCHEGPPAARVKEIRVEWEAYRGEFPDFRIV
ncbi:MAG: acylphosphatase [Deltaproteobacteria bacterium]|nr:acylphosphatase [Deltaproteobacteria bacterium]